MNGQPWPVLSANGRRNGDFRLVAALAGGATTRDAALAVGLSERTVRRRLQEAGFREEVRRARGELFERALALLADASGEAVETLRRLLQAESEMVRLGACRAVLELGTRIRESVELAERVAELETAVGPGRKPRWPA